jgi:hypothetical protein
MFADALETGLFGSGGHGDDTTASLHLLPTLLRSRYRPLTRDGTPLADAIDALEHAPTPPSSTGGSIVGSMLRRLLGRQSQNDASDLISNVGAGDTAVDHPPIRWADPAAAGCRVPAEALAALRDSPRGRALADAFTQHAASARLMLLGRGSGSGSGSAGRSVRARTRTWALGLLETAALSAAETAGGPAAVPAALVCAANALAG